MSETVRRSRISILREIVSTGKPQQIEGMDVPKDVAEMILKVYDDLSPESQENFAAEMSQSGFRRVAKKCANMTQGHSVLGPASAMLKQLLQGLGGPGIEIVSFGTIQLGPEEAKELFHGKLPDLLKEKLQGPKPKRRGKKNEPE